jgi:large subunit ribosomal protein L13
MSQKIRNAVKTTRAVKKNFNRPWYVLDASKEPLGRLATKAARLLTGKNRADYSQDVDMGGMVVIINAKETKLTGEKPKRKNYFRHSGYLGGLKVTSFEEQMAKDCTVPAYKAVKGMLPKNRHRDLRTNQRLFIFPASHNLSAKMEEVN